jgi:carnitine monooxygenase subunit
VRETDGTLRGYANVCPHLWHRLLDGQGTRARITCPYRAWTFGLDGALRGAKGVSRRDVDFDGLGLIGIAVDTLAGLVFGNASSDAVPLRTYALGLEGQMWRACLRTLKAMSLITKKRNSDILCVQVELEGDDRQLLRVLSLPDGAS